MMEDLFFHPAMREGANPALPLLMAFSMFRDDCPWLHELAAQFSRAVEHGDKRGMHMARKSIMNAIEMLHHSPMGDMRGVRDDESMMMLHHLARMVERYLPDFAQTPRATKTSTTTTTKSSEAKEKPEE
jgi:hypothetical protein